MRRSWVLGVLAAAVMACGKGGAAQDDDPGTAKVKAAGAVVKRGPIGDSGDAQLSYALVDVENASTKDRLVTVQGKLWGPEGEAKTATAAATLGADELRVPAHEVRTFALVADGVAPEGSKATFEVLHATAVDYPPPIELAKRQDRRGDLFVAVGSVKNTVERAASAVVACAFYDAAGKVLSRPFTVVELPASGEQVVRFEGPKDSDRAVMFVGQVAYKP